MMEGFNEDPEEAEHNELSKLTHNIEGLTMWVPQWPPGVSLMKGYMYLFLEMMGVVYFQRI